MTRARLYKLVDWVDIAVTALRDAGMRVPRDTDAVAAAVSTIRKIAADIPAVASPSASINQLREILTGGPRRVIERWPQLRAWIMEEATIPPVPMDATDATPTQAAVLRVLLRAHDNGTCLDDRARRGRQIIDDMWKVDRKRLSQGSLTSRVMGGKAGLKTRGMVKNTPQAGYHFPSEEAVAAARVAVSAWGL